MTVVPPPAFCHEVIFAPRLPLTTLPESSTRHGPVVGVSSKQGERAELLADELTEKASHPKREMEVIKIREVYPSLM